MKTQMITRNMIIDKDAPILVTGAAGFIGKWVVSRLLEKGFNKIICLVRSSLVEPDTRIFPGASCDDPRIEILRGNLLSRDDCVRASRDAKVIYHLAAGRGEKSFASAFLNSVVTTRNLLEASLLHSNLIRFVNVSSFAVYTNRDKPRRRLLDELCEIERFPALRRSAYCFAKVKQEQLVLQYVKKYNLSYSILRPGIVYGPGNEALHGRVGIGTFGLFLHMGGSNRLPLTYVENCAEAIVLAGILEKGDGQTYNVVDDGLPTSRRFLSLYKRKVRSFPSIYMPHAVSYLFCYLWEKYSAWSQGQLPDSFNIKDWHATWKKTFYSNKKLKQELGWGQLVPTTEGLNKHFLSCRENSRHA